MNIDFLYNNNQNIKLVKSLYDKDLISLNANDFELALRDISVLDQSDRYMIYQDDLRWFQPDYPYVYSKSLNNFLNYLTYILLIKILKTQVLDLGSLEVYFTNQVLSYLTHNKASEVELKKVYTYWKNTFEVLFLFTEFFKKYSNVHNNCSVYFTANPSNYKINLPLIAWNNTAKEIDCFLCLTYKTVKPNWFTVPSIYKIYSYFANHNITLKNLHIFWFNLNEAVKPYHETITISKNVADMVSRYSDLNPFPYSNIFSKNSSYYYNITPLQMILK